MRQLKPFETAWLFLVAIVMLVSAIVADRFRWTWGGAYAPVTFRTEAVRVTGTGKVKVFFVGSSHTYCGVDPSKFRVQTANLAESGLNYEFGKVLVNHFWKSVSQSDVVVIEYDAVPFYKNTILFRDGDLRDFWQWGLSPSDLSLAGWERVVAEIQRNTGIGRYSAVCFCGFVATPAKVEVGPGFQAHADEMDPESQAGKIAFFEALGTSFSAAEVEKNQASLRSMIERLHLAGVQVVLFRPPFHPDYWRHSSGLARESIADGFLESLLKDYHLVVLDYRRSFTQMDEHYSDWTHLSRKGASLFSHRLNADLLSEISSLDQ